SVPLERDRRCPYQLRTSGSTAPARFGKGCIGSETSDKRRHFGVLAIQLQMERRYRERPSAPRQISPNRPGEIIVRESEEPARLRPTSLHNPTSHGSRTGAHRKGPARQLPVVSHR